jgi:F-type H+-transporting ATPase subunit b
MRTRKLLAATFLAAVTLVLAGGAAYAQTPTTTTTPAGTTPTSTKVKGEAEEACIHILENGGTAEDCNKAPSLILPATNELIWGSVSFAVLFVLLAKFAWPGLKKGMEARTDRIRTDIEQADTAKAEAEHVLEEYRAQLAEAKSEAARIIEESRQAADAIKRDQEQRLQTELAEMRARAQADVEAAKAQAVADLRNEVAQIAIQAAELVVQKNLDPATQRQLVDTYIDQLARRAN